MPTAYRGDDAAIRALNGYIKLSRAASAVEARVNGYLPDYGLTLSQFGVLEALYHLGPLYQQQLAQKILKSSGNLTLVIDNLVKRGLVARCREARDRRYVQIHLTDQGRELIAHLMPAHVERVTEVLSALSPEEQELLGRLCKKLGLSAQRLSEGGVRG